jgi:hypothetical protein
VVPNLFHQGTAHESSPDTSEYPWSQKNKCARLDVRPAVPMYYNSIRPIRWTAMMYTRVHVKKRYVFRLFVLTYVRGSFRIIIESALYKYYLASRRPLLSLVRSQCFSASTPVGSHDFTSTTLVGFNEKKCRFSFLQTGLSVAYKLENR